MRLTISLLLPTTLIAALQLPNFSSFLSALPISIDDYILPNTTTTAPPAHDLLKRQYSNTCPTTKCATSSRRNTPCSPISGRRCHLIRALVLTRKIIAG